MLRAFPSGANPLLPILPHPLGIDRSNRTPHDQAVMNLPGIILLLALSMALAACSSPKPEPRPGTISINTGGIGGPNIKIGGIDNDDDTPATIDID